MVPLKDKVVGRTNKSLADVLLMSIKVNHWNNIFWLKLWNKVYDNV